MRARVRLRVNDAEHVLGHGDLVGRLWSAALCLDDPRISEAHAMVSLRGDALYLLALRGRLAIGDVFQEQIRLDPGLVVQLAPEIAAEVVSVTFPDAVLALEADGLGQRILHGTCGLVGGPRPAIVPAMSDDAAGLVWYGPEGWRIRLGDGVTRPLHPGDVVDVGGTAFRALEVPLGGDPTPSRTKAGTTPLRLVARYDTVHVHREGRLPATLDGIPARLVSELARFATPVPWAILAGELWAEDADSNVLRRRLDAALGRLRSRLAEIEVRADLVRSTGVGQIELFLHPGDTVEDQT